MHVAHTALRPAFGAASAGRPHPHREHPPVALRAFFRCDLGAHRGQPERFAGGAIRNCPRPSGRGAFVACWRAGRERLSSTERPSLAKIWPPCFTRARSLLAASTLWNRTCPSLKRVAHRPLKIPPVELPRDDAAEQECDRRLKVQGAQEFALLNPGAGWGAKQWPAERYGEVARATGGKWSESADQLRSRRRRPRQRRRRRQRRRGGKIHRIAHATDRAHASRAFVYRRRYRPHASGGGAGSSGGGDFRPDRSRAQRSVRHPQHRAAQSRQQHQLPPRGPGR